MSMFGKFGHKQYSIYAAVAKILENTRSVYLNPFLKETVRTECKDMVPSGDDLEAARRNALLNGFGE